MIHQIACYRYDLSVRDALIVCNLLTYGSIMVTGPKGHGSPRPAAVYTLLPGISELMFSLMASVRLSTGGRGLYDAQWEDAKLSTHVNILTNFPVHKTQSGLLK